jgi:hypothetical protein
VLAVSNIDVVNHPQSLWITLWVSFRGFAQVAYHKGFFFDRSNFERSVFLMVHQGLSVIFPLSRRVSLGRAQSAT